MPGADHQQYILLPRQGVRAVSGPAYDLLRTLRDSLGGPAVASPLAPEPVTVLDSVQENGAKLVELDAAAADSINRSDTGVRALPLVEYPLPDPRPALNAPPRSLAALPAPPPTLVSLTITCRDAATNAPVAGATVVAFTDFAARKGAQGTTGAAGDVHLQLGANVIERLYVYGPAHYWGGFRRAVPAADATIPLAPVDLSFVDLVRHYYGASRFIAATGVTVGIIDTGGGPHGDLNFLGGHCTVTGEADADWRDHNIHGTHVAGLIGASGGLRGVAPGVALRAYRVFPDGEGGATNYAILKALILAAQEQCDIVNLSLGGGPFDEIVEEALADACNQGMLPIIAAGNDGRKAVSFPAAHKGAVAVSAFGREQSFPTGSVEEADILRPPSSAVDPLAFIADFSNVGPQIAVTGAGVGVLSTLPNNDYGPLSGTSMAAPVVAGATASLLSQNPTIFGMPRDRARSDAIRNLLLQNCVKFGFGAVYEGFGMPDPQVV